MIGLFSSMLRLLLCSLLILGLLAVGDQRSSSRHLRGHSRHRASIFIADLKPTTGIQPFNSNSKSNSPAAAFQRMTSSRAHPAELSHGRNNFVTRPPVAHAQTRFRAAASVSSNRKLHRAHAIVANKANHRALTAGRATRAYSFARASAGGRSTAYTWAGRRTHAHEDSESADEPDDKPLYVLPMVPIEWKKGNLITNPFQNAIDPQALENGWTPGQEAAQKGMSPNPTGPADQTGIPVQPTGPTDSVTFLELHA